MIEKVLQAVNTQQKQLLSQQSAHPIPCEIEGVINFYWFSVQVLLGMVPQASSSRTQRKNVLKLQEAEELLIQFAFSGFLRVTHSNSNSSSNSSSSSIAAQEELSRYENILQSLYTGSGGNKPKPKKKGTTTTYCFRSFSTEQKQQACQDALKMYQQYILVSC